MYSVFKCLLAQNVKLDYFTLEKLVKWSAAHQVKLDNSPGLYYYVQVPRPIYDG